MRDSQKKRLEGLPVFIVRSFFQIFFDRADDILTQLAERRVLPNIECFQLFGQAVFVESRQRPMSEVVGKTFGQEVMFLHGPETYG